MSELFVCPMCGYGSPIENGNGGSQCGNGCNFYADKVSDWNANAFYELVNQVRRLKDEIEEMKQRNNQ